MPPPALSRSLSHLVRIALVAITAVLPVALAQKPISAADMSIGNPAAHVIIEEYASPTCPACADWREHVFPRLEAAYIATGRALFVLKETPSHNKVVDAAIFAIARCVAPARYFEVIDAALRRHRELDRASREAAGPRQALDVLAGEFGLAGDKLDACLDDPENAKRLARVRAEAIRLGVTGTPTLLINGVMVDARDAADPDRMSGLVASALAAAR